MSISVMGNGGTVAEVDGTMFRAQRFTLRPPDCTGLGAYRATVLSGTMAAGLAADSEIVQFRWTDATRLCVIEEVVLDGLSGGATVFAAGFAKVDLAAARAWSVDGSGGAALTLAGNNNKLRATFGTTLLNGSSGALRASTTAALTAGTKTLDANPIGQIAFSIGTAASVNYLTAEKLFHSDGIYDHPLVLVQNEGFVIRATVPGTGTWQFGATVRWTELANF